MHEVECCGEGSFLIPVGHEKVQGLQGLGEMEEKGVRVASSGATAPQLAQPKALLEGALPMPLGNILTARASAMLFANSYTSAYH